MKFLSFLLLLYLICLQLSAQEAPKFEFEHTFASEAFGDERTITIYLPPHFYKEPNEKFAVTYVLDGHYEPVINMGVKIIEYGTYNYKNIPTIVVGIHAKQRGWEFSALLPGEKKEDISYQGGRAPELQQHFKNEVFKEVEDFEAVPGLKDRLLEFRALIGHSSGGQFVLYSLFSEEKDLFDAYIAISPAIRPGEHLLYDNLRAVLQDEKQLNKFLFCSTGSVSGREELFGRGLDTIETILSEYPSNGLVYRRRKIEGAEHFSMVAPSFSMGMVEMTRAYRVDEYLFEKFAENPDLSIARQVDEFYKKTEASLGFIEIPKASYFRYVAGQMREGGRTEKAVEILESGIQYYPDEYRLYRRRGFYLKKLNRFEEAKASYLEGKAKLALFKDRLSEEKYQEQVGYFDENLKEIEDK